MAKKTIGKPFVVKKRRARNGSMFFDIKGMRFGRLVALRDSGKRTPSGGIFWLCRCDCGAKRLVWSVSLRQGQTKSCGCLKRDQMCTLARRFLFKHGQTNAPIYNSWCSMIKRCKDPNDPYYGARGITVCERWKGKHGFENFLADLGPRPADQSLDRINVNGNYEPGNCRWATALVQAQNRRCCIKDEEMEIGIG